MRRGNVSFVLLAVLVLGWCLWVATAAATTLDWTGADQKTAWSDGSNWYDVIRGRSGIIPSFDDYLIFSDYTFTTPPNNQDIVGLSINGMTFNSHLTSDAQIAGHGLTIGAGGIIQDSSRNVWFQSSVPVTLGADQGWATSGGGQIITQATLAIGGHSLSVGGNGGLATTAGMSGSGNVTASGATGLYFWADSGGFSGIVTAHYSTMYIDSDHAFGTNSLVLDNGRLVAYSGTGGLGGPGTATRYIGDNDTALNGYVHFDHYTDWQAQLAFPNSSGKTISLSDSTALTVNVDTLFDQPILGPGALTVAGGIGALWIRGGHDWTPVSGWGDGVAQNSTYDGLTLQQGTIQMRGGNGDTVGGGIITNGPLGIGDVNLQGGALVINGAPIFHNNVVLNGNVSIGVNDPSGPVFTDANLNSPSTFDVAGDSMVTLNAASGDSTLRIDSVATGGGKLTMAGNGRFFLDNPNNTLSGGVTVSGGQLWVPAGASLGTGPVTVDPGARFYDQSDAGIDAAARLSVAVGGVANMESAAPTAGSVIGDGAIVLGAGSVATNLTVGGDDSDFIFNGTLSEGTAAQGSLTKTGNGVFELAGTAQYTGATTVNAGTFMANRLAGPLVVNDGGVLAFRGAGPSSFTVPALTLNNTGGASPAAATFRLTSPGSSDSISGGAVTLNGTSAINIVEAGWPTAGAYPLIHYTSLTGGTTNLKAGTITGDYDVDSFSVTGSAIVANVIYDPNQWNKNTTDLWEVAGNWSKANSASFVPDNGFSANFFSEGSGTVDLASTSRTVKALNFDNPAAGYTIISSSGGQIIMNSAVGDAQINVQSGQHWIAATVILTGGLSVAPSNGSTLEISGDISGTGPLTLKDAGELILSGNNSYTDGTVVDAGTMTVSSPGGLLDGSSLTVGNAGAFAPVIPEPAASSMAAAPVPEPGTLALVVAGAALMAMYRKRRCRSNRDLIEFLC